MDPEQRTRIAAGESEELPPPPPTDDDSESDAEVLVEPGAGGPDDAGDVRVDPDDLDLLGH